MNFRLIVVVAAAFITGVAFAQDSRDIPAGNMHFDPKAMDMNGDGMITKDEFMRYGETMWERMDRAQKVKIPVADAAADFARGNMHFDAKAMDTNGDGMISKEEFMAYSEGKFDDMKKDPQGRISVADAAQSIGRGNQPASY